MRDENRVRIALQASPDTRAKVVDGADEVAVAHEDVGQEEPNEYGADPGAHEPYTHD